MAPLWQSSLAMAVTFLLFAYGNFLPDEADHALVADCEDLGPAATAEGYTLVELNAFAGMLTGGAGQVVGRLYRIDHACLAACDKRRDHPNRYHREEILLADGQRAHAYLLHPEQARGRRRVKNGDWQKRFQSERPDPGAFVTWAKSRHSR